MPSRAFSSVYAITRGRHKETPLSMQRGEKTGQQSGMGKPEAAGKANCLGPTLS